MEKQAELAGINWRLAVFKEAGRLNNAHTGDNKTANALRKATDGAFRLLLTATPIEKSIIDVTAK